MADFPNARYHLPVISAFAAESSGLATAVLTGSATVVGGSALWPTSQLAIYVPFRIWTPYLVKAVWWANGAATAGTADVGIYTVGGTLLANSTATTQTGTSTIQTVTLGTALLLSPGSYYMAMLGSTGTTAQYQRIAVVTPTYFAAPGWAQQAVGASTLPATATLAAYAQSYQPLFGIASTTVI